VEKAAALSRQVLTVLKPGAGKLGTAHDTRSRRRRLAQSQDACAAWASQLDALLLELRKSGRGGGDAALRSKAERDGKRALKEYQDANKGYQTAMRAVGDPRDDPVARAGDRDGVDAAADDGLGNDGAGGGGMVEMTDVKLVASGRVRIAYELALEQRDEMLEVNRDISEVAELARDLTDGVEMQSERVDTVLSNTEVALESVKAGNESIRKAAEAQRAARRKMCCIALIVLAILGAILGPTIASLTGSI